jgi:UDP-glucose 4-epimerase
LVELSISAEMALIEALSGVVAVNQLVSSTVPGTAHLDPKADIQDNLIGTINLLEAMAF